MFPLFYARKKKGSDAPPAALVQLSGPLGGAPFFPGWRGLRSEKYESEKTKADGPWGGWVGIPRQMKIEVGVARSSGPAAASAEMFSFA